jgi:predicted ATPase
MSDQRVITAQNNRVGMVSADAISVSITAAHRFMLQFREAVNFWRIRRDFEGRFWRSAHVRLPSPWLMRARLRAYAKNNVFAIVGLEL